MTTGNEMSNGSKKCQGGSEKWVRSEKCIASIGNYEKNGHGTTRLS